MLISCASIVFFVLFVEESVSSEWSDGVELVPMVHNPSLQDHILSGREATPLTPDSIATLIQALKVCKYDLPQLM